MKNGPRSSSRDALTARCSLSTESEVSDTLVCLSVCHCCAIVGAGYLSTEKEEIEAQERAKERELI